MRILRMLAGALFSSALVFAANADDSSVPPPNPTPTTAPSVQTSPQPAPHPTPFPTPASPRTPLLTPEVPLSLAPVSEVTARVSETIAEKGASGIANVARVVGTGAKVIGVGAAVYSFGKDAPGAFDAYSAGDVSAGDRKAGNALGTAVCFIGGVWLACVASDGIELATGTNPIKDIAGMYVKGSREQWATGCGMRGPISMDDSDECLASQFKKVQDENEAAAFKAADDTRDRQAQVDNYRAT